MVYLDTADLAVAAAQSRLAMRLALADYDGVLGGNLAGLGGWMRHEIQTRPGRAGDERRQDCLSATAGDGLAALFAGAERVLLALAYAAYACICCCVILCLIRVS